MESIKTEPLKGGTFNHQIIKITRKIQNKTEVIVKKESNFSNKDLIKEISFILGIPKSAEKHFPKILKYQIDKLPVFYEMPFYNFKTLSELIFSGKDSEFCINSIKKIISFMFKNIFTENIGITEQNYLDKTVFSRVEKRYKELCNESDQIKKIITSKRIIIEGKEYRNPLVILNEIKNNKSLMRKITPKKTQMIHGDFHFDNFLINESDNSDFILIDPRGEKRGYSYDYDLGKLWHSFHGKYAIIQRGLFDLEYEFKGDDLNVKVFSIRNMPALDILNEIYAKKDEFLKIINDYVSEEELELRILFNEAVHFCALAPFHLKKDGIEKEAIGRFLMGVKLLNELLISIPD